MKELWCVHFWFFSHDVLNGCELNNIWQVYSVKAKVTLSAVFQIQEFSARFRVTLKASLNEQFYSHAQVSVCHTPSLTVLTASLKSLAGTDYVSYGKESLIREHVKSGRKAKLWLSGLIAGLLHGYSAVTSLIRPSTLPTHVFWTAPFSWPRDQTIRRRGSALSAHTRAVTIREHCPLSPQYQ